MPNEKNPSVKFSDVQINEIRKVKESGMRFMEIIRHYGISESQLIRVMRGESRKGI